MPSYQTTGIVISRTNFGEADRIIRLLTPEHGKLSTVARGVRKIRSRLAGHLEPFAQTQLSLATGHNLDVITSARLQWYPHTLTADYNRLELAYLFLRLVDRTAQEHEPQPELFAHLVDALFALEAGATGPLPQLWFKLRILQLTGYRPELAHCVVCGTAEPSTSYALNMSRGGIVCAHDTEIADSPLSLAAIKLWRLLSDHPYATVAQITDAAALSFETLPICDLFYEHHLGHAFELHRV